MSGTLSTHERAIVGEELPRSAWRPKREFAHSVRKQPIIDGDAPVLYLVDTLNVGGTETQLAQVALRLRSTSYPVTVGCLRAEGPLVEVLERASISVVEFRKERTLLSVRGIYQLLRLAIFLHRGRFQVVHAHDPWANLLGVPAAWLARTPIIISSRRYLADPEEQRDRPLRRKWRNKAARILYRLSTKVVVNSASVRDVLVKRDGLPPGKIRVIHNGVDLDRFASAPRDRERLFPGVGNSSKLIAVAANMYSRVKGHSCLIVAAGTICREVPEAIFILIGDGKERAKLERQVREAGLEKSFLFLGFRDDVPELLASCDLAVLPSESEGLPNSVLEAMAAGVPVVATCVGGIPEIIDNGQNGLLVPPENPPALAEAILRVLRDRNLAMRLARAGQERVRTHFSFDRVVAELRQLYTPVPLSQRKTIF